ncbi:pentapeptide repeat-containing protein [Variovorax sp. RTB1]|uniref:pentapeptide repeat-containing protein n=1 Tax=Variovorax sp. RTB1 TaxID=3048631 RepID=UPI002B2265D8|nr:pentapeptide repeat-containing protein [Variovorax sp. RTB1]MEB0114782.1 pentapeptide repeat-containing protein [Variovorax sp. RTB1]
MTTWLTLVSTTPFASPLNLPAPSGPRAAIEQAVRDGVDLSFRMIEADLTGAYLEGILAMSATFMGRMDDAKLSKGRFDRAVFHGSLKNAIGMDACFAQASFLGVDLTGLQADRADFRSTNLRGANCSRMVAREALFTGAQFERAITTDMDVEGATVFKANVSHEQLQAMATPYEDIQFHALNGRTPAQAQAAADEMSALGAISRFTSTI